jgi:hypothetical protein
MRRFITTSVSGIFIAILFCVVFTTPAAAKITAEIRADEAGLYVNYDLWILGKSQSTLTPGSQPLVIPVLGVATIELSVLEVQADNKIITVRAKASAPTIGSQPVETDLPVPFGNYGVYYSLFQRQFIPIGDHKIELSALLTRFTTQYDVNINLEPLFSGHWSGTKNPADNTIHETIENPLDGSTFDITVELDYKSAYFTNVTLIVGESAGMPGTPMQFPVPNGSFHIWADFELPEEF